MISIIDFFPNKTVRFLYRESEKIIDKREKARVRSIIQRKENKIKAHSIYNHKCHNSSNRN